VRAKPSLENLESPGRRTRLGTYTDGTACVLYQPCDPYDVPSQDLGSGNGAKELLRTLFLTVTQEVESSRPWWKERGRAAGRAGTPKQARDP
jgi:hypothetical protein